jgi:hypothetical protein
MTTSRLIFVAISSTLFLRADCRHGAPVEPDPLPPAFYGTVLDKDSKPVPDLKVFYTFHVASLAKRVAQAHPQSTILIPVVLAQSAFVEITLSKLGCVDTFATVFRDSLQSGHYSIAHDVSRFPNGLYYLDIRLNGQGNRQVIVLQTFDYDQLFKTPPVAMTNSSGQFVISYDSIGVKRSFGSPYHIDSIDVIIQTPGWISPVRGFHLDSTKAIQFTFTLSH